VVALAALVLALVGPSAALAHPPGTTERVSVSSTGTAGHNFSTGAAVSADGRFVAFSSFASNLVPGDTNGTTDVLVHDRQSGTTERVSVDSRERQSVGGDQDGALDTNFGRPSISADGRLVAFTSDAENLVAGDGNFDLDVFVHDRQTQTTVRSSVRTDGTETGFELGSFNAALSADGQVVAFESEGALVPEDSESPVDVFVHDEQP
jgi:Tol biopolymer transport system component